MRVPLLVMDISGSLPAVQEPKVRKNLDKVGFQLAVDHMKLELAEKQSIEAEAAVQTAEAHVGTGMGLYYLDDKQMVVNWSMKQGVQE